MSGTKAMTASRVIAGSPISVSPPVTQFRIPDELLAVEYDYYTPWDIGPDGRFIMARVRRTGEQSSSTVVVAENWLTELMARARR